MHLLKKAKVDQFWCFTLTQVCTSLLCELPSPSVLLPVGQIREAAEESLTVSDPVGRNPDRTPVENELPRHHAGYDCFCMRFVLQRPSANSP